MALSPLQQFAQTLTGSGKSSPMPSAFSPKKSQTPFIFAPKANSTPANMSNQQITPMPKNVPNMTSYQTSKPVVAPSPAYKPAPVPASPSNTGTAKPTLPPAGQEYASSLNTTYNTAPTPSTTTSSSEKDKPKNKYIDNLKAEQFPNAFKAETESRNKAAERLATIQSEREKVELEARRAYEKELDKPGGTLAGAQQAAALSRRRSNTELADIAVQESAALRAAQVSQGILESAQGQDRQLTLDELQALNDAGANLPFGTTISQAQQNGAITTTAATKNAGTKQITSESAQAYADLINSGQMNIENVPSEDRGAVAELVRLGTNTANTQISGYRAQALERMNTTINSIMNSVSNWTTGFGSWLDVVPGSDARNFKAELDTLKANIGFQELTAMRDASKTGGALGNVSDTEIRLLTNVLGALDTGQSPENFKKNLQIVQDGLQPFLEEINLMNDQGGGGSGEGGDYDF